MSKRIILYAENRETIEEAEIKRKEERERQDEVLNSKIKTKLTKEEQDSLFIETKKTAEEALEKLRILQEEAEKIKNTNK